MTITCILEMTINGIFEMTITDICPLSVNEWSKYQHSFLITPPFPVQKLTYILSVETSTLHFYIHLCKFPFEQGKPVQHVACNSRGNKEHCPPKNIYSVPCKVQNTYHLPCNVQNTYPVPCKVQKHVLCTL